MMSGGPGFNGKAAQQHEERGELPALGFNGPFGRKPTFCRISSFTPAGGAEVAVAAGNREGSERSRKGAVRENTSRQGDSGT